ncbi:MAG TPA: DUF4162 domain-containing protein, partial [Nitrolancea sp.]|nr:DUF4162 domain-containing protein [Nitrolancea sp.]
IDQGRVVVEGTPEQLKQELHGDTIQFELENDASGDARSALGQLNGTVREVAFDGRVLRARVENGATALPIIMSALEGAGIGMISVTVARPSLDDVYFRYSGKTFARAQEEGSR